MTIDNEVESTVREVLGAVIARDLGRFEAGLATVGEHGDDFATRALQLAISVCATAVVNVHGRAPSPEEARALAERTSKRLAWAGVPEDEVAKYVGAVVDGTALDTAFDGQRLTLLTFMIAGSLVSASTGERGTWENYLDEIEGELEHGGLAI